MRLCMDGLRREQSRPWGNIKCERFIVGTHVPCVWGVYENGTYMHGGVPVCLSCRGPDS